MIEMQVLSVLRQNRILTSILLYHQTDQMMLPCIVVLQLSTLSLFYNLTVLLPWHLLSLKSVKI